METITITLSEERAEALREKAAQYQLTPEELVQRSIDEMLIPSVSEAPVANGLELSEEERADKFGEIVADLLVRRKWLYEQLAKGPE